MYRPTFKTISNWDKRGYPEMADLLAQLPTINLAKLRFWWQLKRNKLMSESDSLRGRVSLGHLFWVPIYFSFILFYNPFGNHTCKENLVMTPPPFSTNKNFNFNILEMFFNYQYCFFINFLISISILTLPKQNSLCSFQTKQK